MFGFFNKNKDSTGKFKRPYYSLRNVHADKVLDIEQKGPNAGTATIYKPWGGDNQCFSFLPIQGSDQFYIRCKSKSSSSEELFLTVEGFQDGAPVRLAPKNGDQNQMFRIQDFGDKRHAIFTFCGKVLDVLQWKKDEGSRVSQYTASNDLKKAHNQLWNFCDPKDVTSSSSHND